VTATEATSPQTTAPPVAVPPVVDLATWQAARDELLVREKAHTRCSLSHKISAYRVAWRVSVTVRDCSHALIGSVHIPRMAVALEDRTWRGEVSWN
jgi:hypothetical protein